MSLKSYAVYLKDDKGLESSLFLKDGFSWGAFIFTLLWAFYYRLWLVGILGVVILGLTNWLGASGYISPIAQTLLELSYALWMGFNGRHYLSNAYLKRGYYMLDIVTGQDEGHAQQRFFDHYAHA